MQRERDSSKISTVEEEPTAKLKAAETAPPLAIAALESKHKSPSIKQSANTTSKPSVSRSNKIPSILFGVLFVLGSLSLSKGLVTEMDCFKKDLLLQISYRVPRTSEVVHQIDPTIFTLSSEADDFLMRDIDFKLGISYYNMGHAIAGPDPLTPDIGASEFATARHHFREAIKHFKIRRTRIGVNTANQLEESDRSNDENSNSDLMKLNTAAKLEDWIGTSYCYLGEFKNAIPHLKNAYQLSQKLNEKQTLYMSELNHVLGFCLYATGDFEGALTEFQKRRDFFTRYGVINIWAIQKSYLYEAKCLYHLGRIAEAKALLTQIQQAKNPYLQEQTKILLNKIDNDTKSGKPIRE